MVFAECAPKRLTGDDGTGVHSGGDIGGGHVEAFAASIHASPHLRSGGMRRTGAQAHRKVLQHQVLLD
jgi:hypothetical protein